MPENAVAAGPALDRNLRELRYGGRAATAPGYGCNGPRRRTVSPRAAAHRWQAPPRFDRGLPFPPPAPAAPRARPAPIRLRAAKIPRLLPGRPAAAVKARGNAARRIV